LPVGQWASNAKLARICLSAPLSIRVTRDTPDSAPNTTLHLSTFESITMKLNPFRKKTNRYVETTQAKFNELSHELDALNKEYATVKAELDRETAWTTVHHIWHCNQRLNKIHSGTSSWKSVDVNSGWETRSVRWKTK
jgi:hypothetical protein